MTDQEKRKAIAKYFKPFPKWGFWWLLIGILIASVGSRLGAAVAIGAAIMAIGAIGIWTAVSGRPSDEQMDKLIEEDLTRVSDEMIRKLGIDKSELVADSQLVYGPGSGTQTEAAKVGKDKKLRYNPIYCASMGFGVNQLFYYTCLLDIISGNMLRESTDEYFYKDVVSVSTKTTSLSFLWKGRSYELNDAESFTLTTAGGTSFTVFLRDPQLAGAMGVPSADIPTGDADKAIQVIRRMLREKKE